MVFLELTWPQICTYGLIGALGGFVKQIVDNEGILILPTVKDHKLYLGFVSHIIIGAVAGIIADHHPLTAGLGGYAGTQIVEKTYQKLKRTRNGKLDIWGGKFN